MTVAAQKHVAPYSIDEAVESDFAAIKRIFFEVIEEGETYSYESDELSDAWIKDYWLTHCVSTLVARVNGEVAGVCAIRFNRTGRADHVANASYIVCDRFRGMGIGRALGQASIERAREKGFQAIQFNYVVSTNTRAVTLWQSLGFEVVGTLPKGFQHVRHGLVDVLILHRFL